MSDKTKLEDTFLHDLHEEQAVVSIFLVNGIKLNGTIDSYDEQVILLKNTFIQMVYKHAISTVVPARPVKSGAG